MPAEPSLTRRQLGTLLAARRKAMRINAREMGAKIARSHTHVTRVERAEAPISLSEAQVWLDATQASASDRETVRALIEAAAAESTPWRLDAGAALQAEAARRVESATVVESFVWQIVPGLLQTEAYCRDVAARFGVTDLDEYVAARRRRQRVLDEPGREFRFVVRDEILSTVDEEQRDHISWINKQVPSVTVRSIAYQRLPARATCSFDLHSDHSGPIRVGIELPHGGLELTGADDLAVYRDLYAELFETATAI